MQTVVTEWEMINSTNRDDSLGRQNKKREGNRIQQKKGRRLGQRKESHVP